MRVFASTAALILLAAITGCGKSNPVKPPLPQPKYAPSSTPQNALYNLRLAYATRDSSGYDSLFDAAYVGTSIDQSDPTPALITFTKADESLHIRALAQRSTISTISFVFPATLRRDTDAADTLGWATVDMYPFQIEIEDGPTSFIVGPLEYMSFKLRPVTPSPGSPTDTTWHIVRWTEAAR